MTVADELASVRRTIAAVVEARESLEPYRAALDPVPPPPPSNRAGVPPRSPALHVTNKAHVPKVIRTWEINNPKLADGDVVNQGNSYRLASLYHACVAERACAVGQAPFAVTLTIGSGTSRETRSVGEDDRLLHLLQNPNPEMTSTSWRRQIESDLWTFGRHHTRKMRSPAGLVVELHPLRADLCEVVPLDFGTRTGFVYGPEANRTVRRGEQSEAPASQEEIVRRGWEFIPSEDMIYLKRWNPADQWTGLSPAVTLFHEGLLDKDSILYLASMFRNGGIPSAILSLNEEVDEEEAKRYQARMREMYGYRDGTIGGAGYGEWAVLGGGAKVEQFGLDPSSMDVRGVARVAESRVCAVMQVPTLLVGAASGGEQSNAYGHLKETRYSWWFEHMIPELSFIEEELTLQLARDFNQPGRAYRVMFDRSRVPAIQGARSQQVRDSLQEFRNLLVTRDHHLTQTGREPVDGRPVYADELGVLGYVATAAPAPGSPDPPSPPAASIGGNGRTDGPPYVMSPGD